MNTQQSITDDESKNRSFQIQEDIKHNRGNLRCPHCGEHGNRRSSQEIDITLREIYFQCPNVFCGFAWKASLVFDYGVSPSAQPNPDVSLKMNIVEKKIIDDPPDNQVSIFEVIDKN